MDTYLNKLINAVRELSDAKDTEYFKKYLHNKFDSLGVCSPKLKFVIKKYFIENGKPEYNNIKNYVKFLWELPKREFQYIALIMAEKKSPNL